MTVTSTGCTGPTVQCRSLAGEYPSGQRGRAVNPLALPTEVRILSPPPLHGRVTLEPMADAGHVRFARELEERDERLAAALARVRALQAEVDELRSHAAAAVAFRAAYPGERERLAGEHAAAADELLLREAALA